MDYSEFEASRRRRKRREQLAWNKEVRPEHGSHQGQKLVLPGSLVLNSLEPDLDWLICSEFAGFNDGCGRSGGVDYSVFNF